MPATTGEKPISAKNSDLMALARDAGEARKVCMSVANPSRGIVAV
jgi:hypothetical protein